jgi:hypothetical protein
VAEPAGDGPRRRGELVVQPLRQVVVDHGEHDGAGDHLRRRDQAEHHRDEAGPQRYPFDEAAETVHVPNCPAPGWGGDDTYL